MNAKGSSFYFLSDFMPGLRWQYADDSRRVRNTGWFTDSSCSDTVRGLVFRLPHGRGFLPGWTMGEGMSSTLEYCIVDDFDDCAVIADDLARQIADGEREHEYENEIE